MKSARVYCLLLICCAAHGCAEFKRGFAEGQVKEIVRQAEASRSRGTALADRGDAKYADAWKKFEGDREGALRLAAESSDLYEQSAEWFDKAAALTESAGRLGLAETGKEYYRAKAAQFGGVAEMMRVRRKQVAALSASGSLDEAYRRAQAFKERIDELLAKNQRLEEKATKLRAEGKIVVAVPGDR
jgi:hypothetical protein